MHHSSEHRPRLQRATWILALTMVGILTLSGCRDDFQPEDGPSPTDTAEVAITEDQIAETLNEVLGPGAEVVDGEAAIDYVNVLGTTGECVSGGSDESPVPKPDLPSAEDVVAVTGIHVDASEPGNFDFRQLGVIEFDDADEAKRYTDQVREFASSCQRALFEPQGSPALEREITFEELTHHTDQAFAVYLEDYGQGESAAGESVTDEASEDESESATDDENTPEPEHTLSPAGQSSEDSPAAGPLSGDDQEVLGHVGTATVWVQDGSRLTVALSVPPRAYAEELSAIDQLAEELKAPAD
ncbi:hypothetical protein QDX21_04825 [Auritidibacter ignavus]|uniref:Uncharacterized protein n=1 Tax=Auritidibacter ignavus TaxID=678932 RepID=A0AAJ6AJZ4_9MICC|nr:hypothetical protein [Auritidibacter ignavus]WGH94117.1 hypothetical protein QDX21_04825 [Auritidibacter ignavus]